jgi:hypothetical protein
VLWYKKILENSMIKWLKRKSMLEERDVLKKR